MVSNNTLAFLVLVSLVVSIVGMALVYNDSPTAAVPEGIKTSTGMVKLNVVPQGTLPPTGAMVKLNVVENKGG